MSGPAAPRLQPLARARVARLGAQGEAWLAALPAVLARLEDRWGLTLGPRSLPGGSAGVVLPAETADGRPCALKIAVPDADLGPQARVLAAADGHGYARLLAHDLTGEVTGQPGHQALLLERLGRSAEQTPVPPERTVPRLLDALQRAWQVPAAVAAPFSPELARAATLARSLPRDPPHDAPDVEVAVLARAGEYAARRAAALDPRRLVVVHGDPHPGNLLRVEVPRAGAEDGWALVDPDGRLDDPTRDVGVTLRDHSAHLRGPDAARVLRGWCDRAAGASGQDPQAVWEWAFLERVATGLYVASLGADRVARPFLETAAGLLEGD